MGWTVRRVDKLMALWNEGYSGTEIAKELGGVSRSAVLGKAFRLGLPRRREDRQFRHTVYRGRNFRAPSKPRAF